MQITKEIPRSASWQKRLMDGDLSGMPNNCVICDKEAGGRFWIIMCEGGHMMAKIGTEDVNDPGFMGEYAVGATCAQKYKTQLAGYLIDKGSPQNACSGAISGYCACEACKPAPSVPGFWLKIEDHHKDRVFRVLDERGISYDYCANDAEVVEHMRMKNLLTGLVTAKELGAKGGAATTDAKRAASADNGKRGGRPRKFP